MTKNIKTLLCSHGVFLIGKHIIKIFMVVYIWELTNNIVTVTWYNIISVFFHASMFLLFLPIVKKYNLNIVRKISLILYSIFLIILLLLGDKVINYIHLIAILQGAASGMYWLPYHIQRYSTTNKQNRSQFTGLEKATTIFIQLVVPIIGGVIISMNIFNLNYGPIFILGIIAFAISLIRGNITGNDEYSSSKTDFFKAAKKMYKSVDMRKSIISLIMGGFSRKGALTGTLIPLLIFINTDENKFEYGGIISLFSFSSIVASYLIGKKIKFKNFNISLLFGGITYSLSLLLLVINPSYLSLIIFGIINQLFILFIEIPKRVISENLISNAKLSKTYKWEYLVIREWMYMIFGYLPGYFLIIIFSDIQSNQLKIILSIMAIITFSEVVLLRTIKKENYQ